ncbi:unnamed protein product [Tenebrio molitor]|nr:unnamed protein product [Tenebrio molitor]
MFPVIVNNSYPSTESIKFCFRDSQMFHQQRIFVDNTCYFHKKILSEILCC